MGEVAEEREKLDRPVYSVKSLAQRWECSTRHVYDLISEGEITTFCLGKNKRGLRIRWEEVKRWESARESRTETENTLLVSERAARPLPVSALKAVARASG